MKRADEYADKLADEGAQELIARHKLPLPEPDEQESETREIAAVWSEFREDE